jgi:hypothetical protein
VGILTAQDEFGTLARLEPRLWPLLVEAAAIHEATRGDARFNIWRAWSGGDGWPGIKPRLCRLVGWDRPEPHPVLSTSRAYEVAYARLLAAIESGGAR